MEFRSLELALVYLLRLSDCAVNKLCSLVALPITFVSALELRLIRIDVLRFIDADTASS